MGHASYSYPSHLIPLLDLALVLVAAVLLLLAPERAGRWAAPAWRVLRRLGRRPARTVALLFLLGAAANGVLFLVQGTPIPAATDELSYLLAADTFALGRLANPQHPMWRHFHPHALQWPLYVSKYPPAQGLYFALGQVLTGSPAVAVCVGAGLLPAAACWAFFGWLRPPWAVLGGVLVLLRLGVGSYWHQSYWGGTVAAVAGALVFGALPRLLRRPLSGLCSPPRSPPRGPGLVMVAGLAILANSRPYEGLLVSLPVLAVLGVRALRDPRMRRALLPGAMVLVLAGAAMLIYNQRITGDPFLLPHQAHTIAYNFEANFLFERYTPPELSYQKRAPERSAAPQDVDPRPPWVGRSLKLGAHRLARTLYFLLGLGPALALWLVPWRGRPGAALLAVSCALVVAGQSLVRWWFPHYPAPATVAFFLLMLLSLRRLAGWRRHGRPVGRAAPLAVVAIYLVLLAVELPAHRPDPSAWNVARQRIERELATLPGKHLVLVYPPNDWISNSADVDAATVVWARQVDEASDRRLVEYFRDRRIWWLDLTGSGTPTPVPYSELEGEAP